MAAIVVADEYVDDEVGEEQPNALQRAFNEHLDAANPRVESLSDLGAIFLRVESALRQQSLFTERLLRVQQRGGAAGCMTPGGAMLYPRTVTMDFTGTLDELARQPTRRQWTAIDRHCVLPELSAEQLAELFPNNEVLVAGAFITYVDSTFPCKLGFDMHEFSNLPRNETAGSRRSYHFIVGKRMHFEGKHTLMNADDPDAERLMREHPEYTPANIDRPNFAVFYDESIPNKKSLKSNHPGITFAALALGDMGTTEALQAQEEILDAAAKFAYVQMDKAQADMAVAAAKRRWEDIMKVVTAEKLTTAKIDRMGYKFDSVEGLAPDGSDRTNALLMRTQLPLTTTQANGSSTTATTTANGPAALNGSAVLRTASKQQMATTNGVAELTAGDAYNAMLHQPYTLTVKVEMLLRSPKGSSLKNVK